MSKYFVHPHALVETKSIGDGTRIWAYAHVMEKVIIGKECNLGDHVFIESGVRIGDGVTIKNGVAIWEGVQIGDFVFVGPNAVFTNDLFPRSSRQPEATSRYKAKEWLKQTIVKKGTAVGANATILCGLTLGEYCMIGAGSVVTSDVPPYRLVYGSPAKIKGIVNKRGEILQESGVGKYFSKMTKKKYLLKNNELWEV